jgi:hypothetical protein
MSSQDAEIDAALSEIARALKLVKKGTTAQLRSLEDRDFLKATALGWFRSRRNILALAVPSDVLEAIDGPFRVILDSSERAASRNTYITALKEAKVAFHAARGATLALPTSGGSDASPDFSPLAADLSMQAILTRRWEECQKCMNADAPLAGTVMMGGLLEALFVARANRLSDKSALFKCATTPIDTKTKKPLDLRQWTLAPYIDVGHELGWITRSAKDVAVILRDYRNYVHPEKERSHGVILTTSDARMFWDLTKSLSRQLLSLAGAT